MLTHLLVMSVHSLIDKRFFRIKCSPYGVLKSNLCNNFVDVMKKTKPNASNKIPRLIGTRLMFSCRSTMPNASVNDAVEIAMSFDTLAVNRFDADSCILKINSFFLFFYATL